MQAFGERGRRDVRSAAIDDHTVPKIIHCSKSANYPHDIVTGFLLDFTANEICKGVLERVNLEIRHHHIAAMLDNIDESLEGHLSCLCVKLILHSLYQMSAKKLSIRNDRIW